jgi:hypothetical protein
MSLNSLIKKIIKEETEEWVDVSPEDYKELLDYVNGDGSIIKRLPDYNGKKIRITGELDLRGKEKVTNIDSIDLVQGNLDIGYTKIPFFDKNKVRGRFDYFGSEMQRLEKQKIYEERIAQQELLRQDDDWNVENNDKESNETEAIFKYLKGSGIVEEGEDKYFLFNTNYKHYGNSSVYLWLGSKNFESEYVVYEGEDNLHEAAKEHLESLIDDIGFDTFREYVWENHIDERYVRDYLYEDYSEYIRQTPEDWNINKELTDQQKQYLEIHQASINRLNQKLEEGGLTDEEVEEIESDIYDYEQLIEDIKENPEGDYDEELIEEAIENMVDDNVDNIFDLLKDRGFDNQDLLDFVDVDAAIEYVIRSDGYGQVLNGYDGTVDSYTINGEEYYVMRYN